MPHERLSTDQRSTARGIVSIFAQARTLAIEGEQDSSALVELSIELASLLLRESRLRESQQEEGQRRALAQLMTSEENQRFSTALTDRIHRSPSAPTTVNVLKELAARTSCESALPAWDRLQLRAARMFGSYVPDLTRQAIVARLRAEARPYLWDAAPEALSAHLASRHHDSMSVNLNYLGEEVLGDSEAAKRLSSYLSLVRRADIDAVSIKLSGLLSHPEILAFDETVLRLHECIVQIAEAAEARPLGPPLIYFDMEAYRDFALTEELMIRLLSDQRLLKARFGVAVQAYLPEAVPLILRLSGASAERCTRGAPPLRIRLVKGANLLMEKVEASSRRIEVPVLPTKLEVDANFKRALRSAMGGARSGRLLLGVGSHNIFDISYALLLREQMNLREQVQFEMLEGMAGALGGALRQVAGSLLIYAPAVLEDQFASAVSYLVRRLDENTAEENFLRVAPFMQPLDRSFGEQADMFRHAWTASQQDAPTTLRTQNRSLLKTWSRQPGDAFENASDTDFTRKANRQWVDCCRKEARSELEAGLVKVIPLVGFSVEERPGPTIPGFDPSEPSHSYEIQLVTQADVTRAIDVAAEAVARTGEATRTERAELLFSIAEELERNRGRLIFSMVLDAGKRVQEADVEVSEAIDFARYYAKSALTLPDNALPRGVIVITPPWNFPLAIPLGGVLAALAGGNAVILKPAPETPWVAFLAAQICLKAGVRADLLQFLPCEDEDAAPLLTDERVKAVVLTGATETARHFLRKRPDLCLMAETGGKNAAYVSPVSDREQAISQAVVSAFGHAGQKCSALSVLILHREVFDDERFREQLIDAASSLPVGPAWDPRSIVTPLIRPPHGALRKIMDEGKDYGTWALSPQQDEQNPRLVSPGILWGVEPNSFPHLTEFFGPVLCVIRANDFDHAMQIMNATSYGLTAGLFSLREGEQEAFVRSADAGNLYINRGITGAVVGRQPFGGRKQSCFGPGAKAGGPDYVRQMTREETRHGDPETDYDKRLKSYTLAMESYASVHEGTHVEGESNVYRYNPGRTAIVLCPGASRLDVRLALLAMRLTTSRAPVIVVRGTDTGDFADLFSSTGEEARELEPGQIVSEACSLGVERLRAVGKPPSSLLRLSAERALSMITDPVAEDGRRELSLYLMPQSVSFSYHRHGNCSLISLSKMNEALHEWPKQAEPAT